MSTRDAEEQQAAGPQGSGHPEPAGGELGFEPPGNSALVPVVPPGDAEPGRVVPRNTLGTASLVVGIVAILGCFLVVLNGLLGRNHLIPSWWLEIGDLVGLLAAAICGAVGVVLGVLGLRRIRRGGATNRGAAIGGLVTAMIGLLIGGAFVGILLLVMIFGCA